MGAVTSLCIPGPKDDQDHYSSLEGMVYRDDKVAQVPARFLQKGTAGPVTRAPPPKSSAPSAAPAAPAPLRSPAPAVAEVTPVTPSAPSAPATMGGWFFGASSTDDDAGRRGKFDADRKFRAEVAEMNYKLRNTFGAVPNTRYVSFQDVVAGRKKVAPMCQAPKITFSKWSTADALSRFASMRGHIPCGLNFANGEQVGGGYKSGALAQEEDLCRRIPNLYTSLLKAKRDGLYPFGPCTCRSPDRPAKYSDVLFTDELTIARAGEDQRFEMLPREQQVRISLVTAAAPNINFAKEVYDLRLMRQTVEAVFLAPKLQRKEINTLILGAWGCGAFGGNPNDISQIFADVIGDLGQLYEEVHFAIPGGRWGANGKVFWEKLSKRFDVQEIS